MGACTTKADIMSRRVHIKWELWEWEQSESAFNVLWNAIYCTATVIVLIAFVSWKTYTIFKKGGKKARSSVFPWVPERTYDSGINKDGLQKSPLPGWEFFLNLCKRTSQHSPHRKAGDTQWPPHFLTALAMFLKTNFIFVFSALCHDPQAALSLSGKSPETDTSQCYPRVAQPYPTNGG